MRRKWGENRAAVIDYLSKHPGARPTEIAKATGVRLNSLYTLLDRMKSRNWKGYLLLNVECQMKTYRWLVRTCPKGVSLPDHVVSILVDAMNEDSE